MKVNDKYLIAAHEVLCNNVDGLKDKDKIPSIYNGYVSSFGASMVQSGLLAAIISYNVDPKKKKISDLIFLIYKKVYDILDDSDFENYTITQTGNKQFRENIVQSLISLKLVLRTYEFDKDSTKDQ